MDTILQGLHELEGVIAVLAIDPTGQIVGYRAHSVYDPSLLQQASRIVANAIDSIQLLHENWESVTTSYADGRLLLRNLSTGGGHQPPRFPSALLVIADSRLNLSFAGVAVRVAATKLKNLGTAPAALAASSPNLSASAPSVSTSLPGQQALHASSPFLSGQPGSGATKPDVAGSGLSWSGLGGSSTMAASGVAVSDAVSATYLTAVTKALAKSVGPMAKAFVKEAVRRLCPDRAFSRDLGPVLTQELERHIEDPDDLVQFRRSAKLL